jgi:hypothetical protein
MSLASVINQSPFPILERTVFAEQISALHVCGPLAWGAPCGTAIFSESALVRRFRLLSISPTSGSTRGGQQVVLTGLGLDPSRPDLVVLIADVPCVPVPANRSMTSITCATGPYDIGPESELLVPLIVRFGVPGATNFGMVHTVRLLVCNTSLSPYNAYPTRHV